MGYKIAYIVINSDVSGEPDGSDFTTNIGRCFLRKLNTPDYQTALRHLRNNFPSPIFIYTGPNLRVISKLLQQIPYRGSPVCDSIEGGSCWSSIYSLISAQIDVVAIFYFLR